jgi:peptidoglycan/LPS O-acetylase OafA/YrhL
VQKSSRIPELDGLRGVAILLVIFFHYTNGNALVRSDGLAFYVQRAANAGWSGVDLFFVLSGFLIGGILMDARESPSFFRTFYLRRLFRIVPIYYVWIILYVGLKAAAGAAIQARSFSGRPLPGGFSVYAHLLFLQNFIPMDWPAMSAVFGSWFSHLWSLAVEEQFYLVAPLMIRWLSPRRLPTALVAIVIGAPLFRTLLFLRVHELDVTRIMPSRADTLALGMLAAVVWRSADLRARLQKIARWLYLPAAVLFSGYGLICWYTPGTRTLEIASFGLSWVGIFYTLLLLIALGAPDGWFAHAMRMAWLREIGRVSYCMYIVHLTCALLCYYVLLHQRPEIKDLRGAAVAICSVVVTYLVARASWKFFENPLLRIAHQFQYASPVAMQDRDADFQMLKAAGQDE